MTTDHLLDAIGLVDDQVLASVNRPPFRRKMVTLIAAVLALALCIGSAMAVSPQFRDLIFSIFHIQTQEHPPAGSNDPLPTESGLQELAVVDFDGIVNAHYFTSDGIVLTREGGFYTRSQTQDPAFWEIRPEGIRKIPTTRVNFTLDHGGSSFEIVFDYGVLNNQLAIQVLEESPMGWNVEPIGSRLDAVLLTLPLLAGDYYTHDFLLLDLNTLETTDLLETIPREDVAVDGCRLTSDLHYGILSGIHTESGNYGYWLCDLEEKTIIQLNGDQPYFLDDETMVFQEPLDGERFNVIRCHIPSGVQTVVIPNTHHRTREGIGYRGIQYTGGFGVHALVYLADGSLDLIDLRTGSSLHITGLDPKKLITSESPDGSRIMLAYQESVGADGQGSNFPSLGILNPETGVAQMLTRTPGENPELFWGWLDRGTLVLTAHNSSGGYYVYVYQFQG